MTTKIILLMRLNLGKVVYKTKQVQVSVLNFLLIHTVHIILLPQQRPHFLLFFVMYQWLQLSKDLSIVLCFTNDSSEKSELRHQKNLFVRRKREILQLFWYLT